MSLDSHSAALREEFTRTAPAFARRREGEFDFMDPLAFAKVRPDESVLEVGAGTGAFLSLFASVTPRLVGIDMTDAMLREARRRHPELALAAGDGRRLPVKTRSFDLVVTAQTLHHVPDPVAFLSELRRVVKERGRVLVVDHVASDRFEEAVLMTRLESLRDPSHAASRSPAMLRSLLMAAGLGILDERLVEKKGRFSVWMDPGEFPSERIDAVLDFIDRFGGETGMNFRREQGELVFTTRRMMLLAER